VTNLIRWTSAVALVVLLGACTEHEIHYVERPVFNAPPDSASGFLGYYTPADKQTTCGNCHSGYQASWIGTKHASAWADLQASGHALPSCEGCHTVSQLGNAVDSTAGFLKVADTAYFDVQCESCHGPGLPHIESVFGGNLVRPLASIHVDTGVTSSCSGCHTGTHEPFVDQWTLSKHGYGGTAYIAEGARDPCRNCHEGRAAILNNFQVQTDFVENADSADFQPIVCAVCHNPHDATYEGQLRAPLGEPDLNQVCIHCHAREGAPQPGSSTQRGPHAAQGLLLIDEDVGWIPPGFVYDTTKIVGSHGTTANPRLCAACHVYMFTVTDAATGDFLLNSVGHTFEAIQCLDAQGLPVEGDCDISQRNFNGCAVSGCHGDANAARSAFITVQTRMNTLTDLLWNDVNGNAVLEPTDGGLLPQILAQAIAAHDSNQINLYDNVLTPAEGAIWDAQLATSAERPQWTRFTVVGQKSCTPSATCTTVGSANTGHLSSGEGVHNPFLLEALLLASIDYLTTYYNLSAPPADLSMHATVPPGVRMLR
jgi:predicted CXXCH cytochrome family protein